MSIKVFVYGTLLKGLSRCCVLESSSFIGHGFIQAGLYDLIDYPGITDGNSQVYGELYEISTNKLIELDGIEGFSSQKSEKSLFIRKEIDVTLFNDSETVKAYAYFFNDSLDDNMKIECGDYRRYLLEKNDRQWYIAYGSNMNEERLKERIKEFHCVQTGYLDGYHLVFNKESNYHGRTYANIAYRGSGYRCPFAAYLINKEHLFVLDGFEGEPSHYVRIGIAFNDMTGQLSYIGHIYIANTKKLIHDSVPGPEYLSHIKKGYDHHGFDSIGLAEFMN